MFNTDRGLMDPTNGLLMDEINLNLNNQTDGPQLKENPNQQYYEGNDVFANFQLPNNENEKIFIQQVQNTNNETKQLDSTLFSQDRIDNDIVNRMIIEDINNPASNIMGQDAEDGIRNAKNSQVQAGNFANQIANANTNNVKMQTEEINFKNTSSAVMEALQKLDRGTHVLRLPKFPKPLEAKAQKLLEDIIANPSDIPSRTLDIIRFLPDYANKIGDYIGFAAKTGKVFATGFDMADKAINDSGIKETPVENKPPVGRMRYMNDLLI